MRLPDDALRIVVRGADKDKSRRMKYATARPYADPEKAERRILEIANAVEPIQGRIHIEKINEPFLFRDRGSLAEYGAGLKLAIERGWLKMHESGTFVTFTPAGAELFP
jgi:hypothetical protein